MNNETKSLLSEHEFRKEIESWNGSIDDWQMSTEKKCFEIMEADRSKLMAVLQVCADALNRVDRYSERESMNSDEEESIIAQWTFALSQLKAIGVEPNK